MNRRVDPDGATSAGSDPAPAHGPGTDEAGCLERQGAMEDTTNESEKSFSQGLERHFERLLFGSRWILAPFYFGLTVVLALLVIKFFHQLAITVYEIFSTTYTDLILDSLVLLDLVFTSNLIIMVVFAGYENFVSRIDFADMRDRPHWMGKIDFSGLKLKLIGSIVAISGIHLLKAFMEVENIADLEEAHLYSIELAWMVGIHMAFVVSAVLLALMDYIASRAGHAG